MQYPSLLLLVLCRLQKSLPCFYGVAGCYPGVTMWYSNGAAVQPLEGNMGVSSKEHHCHHQVLLLQQVLHSGS